MTSLQQRQVASLLHDELQCVTVSSLSTRLGISRSQAASLLDQVSKDSQRTYQANYVTREQETSEEIPCTVFRLVAEDYKQQDIDNKFLHSLAVSSNDMTESLATAHERDMAHYRDLVSDNKLATILCDAAKFDTIAPHGSIRDDYNQSIQNAHSDNGMEVESTTASSAPARGGPKKVTTAANFFSAKTATGNKQSVAAKAAKTIAKPVNKPPPIASTKSEEKENSLAKKEAGVTADANAKVGTVDDFVGDEESDESDEDSVDVKLRSMSRGGSGHDSDASSDPLVKPIKKPSLTIVDSDDESAAKETKKTKKKRKDEPVVSGAMDSFAVKKEVSDAATNVVKHKRRRKKLVEKTTMDASGYLHTETQEVWEDIPSDEDVPTVVEPAAAQKAAPKPAASKKNAVPMKQGSLMGFFKKK